MSQKNEINIDVILAIVIPALNPRYEYILERFSGIGIDLLVSID